MAKRRSTEGKKGKHGRDTSDFAGDYPKRRRRMFLLPSHDGNGIPGSNISSVWLSHHSIDPEISEIRGHHTYFYLRFIFLPTFKRNTLRNKVKNEYGVPLFLTVK